MQASPRALWEASQDMHGENSGGCISRRDKSFSLIPSPPRLGGVEDLSHRLQEMEMGGRGQNVNLRIIRQCDEIQWKKGIHQDLVPAAEMINDVLSHKNNSKVNITTFVADMKMERELGEMPTPRWGKRILMILCFGCCYCNIVYLISLAFTAVQLLVEITTSKFNLFYSKIA